MSHWATDNKLVNNGSRDGEKDAFEGTRSEQLKLPIDYHRTHQFNYIAKCCGARGI